MTGGSPPGSAGGRIGVSWFAGGVEGWLEKSGNILAHQHRGNGHLCLACAEGQENRAGRNLAALVIGGLAPSLIVHAIPHSPDDTAECGGIYGEDPMERW